MSSPFPHNRPPASSSPAALFPSSSSPAPFPTSDQHDDNDESLETSANGGSLPLGPNGRRTAAGIAFDPLAIGGSNLTQGELPPSDLPFLQTATNGRNGEGSIPTGLSGIMGAEGGEGAGGGGGASAGRRRGATNRVAWEDVPRVKDKTGEKVMEGFAIFLENFTETIALPGGAGGETGTGTGTDGARTPRARGSSRSGADRTPTASGGAHHDEARDDTEGQEPGMAFYVEQIKSMREYEITTLYVDFTHLMEREETLAGAIRAQYYRFLPYLRRAVAALVRKLDPTYLYVQTNAYNSSDPSAHSTGPTTQGNSSSAGAGGGRNKDGLQMREFNLAFYNLPMVSSIRDLKMDKIGQLVSISGTVTRTSEVRPELIWGTFRCEECRGVVQDVEQQFKYTEPVMCPNATCGNRTNWTLDIEQSKFADWQKVRIQENANEIPTGSMPRSLDVILRAEIVEKAKAGDKCVFTGTFIVVPDVSQLGLPGVNAEIMRQAQGGRAGGEAGGIASQGVTGLKALGVRDLQYKTAFLSCMVQQADARGQSTSVRSDVENGDEDPDAFLNSLTQQEVDELRDMVNADHIYQRLVSSIAPTVYGHEIVKKGILLQLMGGVHKQTPEGINLRGDINVCIVGDPSTSKSQFLK